MKALTSYHSVKITFLLGSHEFLKTLTNTKHTVSGEYLLCKEEVPRDTVGNNTILGGKSFYTAAARQHKKHAPTSQ